MKMDDVHLEVKTERQSETSNETSTILNETKPKSTTKVSESSIAEQRALKRVALDRTEKPFLSLSHLEELGRYIENGRMNSFFQIAAPYDCSSTIDIPLKIQGKTLLIIACENDNLDIVQYLLTEGANVNVVDSGRNTALIAAVLVGRLEIVKLLLDHGADMNWKGSEGCTALLLAAKHIHLDIFRMLLERGADYSVMNADGNTSLVYMAMINDKEIVQNLLDRGADLSVQNKQGFTAMTWAATNTSLNVLNILIEKGADANHQDKQGMTPLMHAVKTSTIEVVKRLLQSGANVHIESQHVNDKDKTTALLMACMKDDKEMIELLLEYGATTSGEFRKACIYGFTDVVKLLIRYNADINEQDMKDNYTPLMWATSEDHIEIIRVLINTGANINAQDKEGGTAIMKFSKERPDILAYLIKQGADVNIQDFNGNTLLHIMVFNDEYENINLLCNLSVDLNVTIKNNDGKTAYNVAQDEDIIPHVKMLEYKGSSIYMCK